MKSAISVLFACALLASAECIQVAEVQYGVVEILTSDLLGNRIDSVTVILAEAGSRKNVQSAFLNGKVRVPYGEYVLRLQAPGFRSSELRIRVHQPDVVVRSQLAVGTECLGYSSISGRIRSKRADTDLWIKAIPLHGTGGSETRVSRYGAFQLAGLDSGEYVLIVLDGPSVTHTRTVKALGDLSVDFE